MKLIKITSDLCIRVELYQKHSVGHYSYIWMNWEAIEKISGESWPMSGDKLKLGNERAYLSLTFKNDRNDKGIVCHISVFGTQIIDNDFGFTKLNDIEKEIENVIIEVSNNDERTIDIREYITKNKHDLDAKIELNNKFVEMLNDELTDFILNGEDNTCLDIPNLISSFANKQ